MVGHSSAMQQLKRAAARAARQDSTVLLLGETGTGKELLAHAIHAESARTGKPFVAINVAAIPDSLLEAELLAPPPAPTTGADRKDCLGKIQLADGGTLFLDEIGDMPLNLQASRCACCKKEVEPLGSNRVPGGLAGDCRHQRRPAAPGGTDGSFRADLYYRLNVCCSPCRRCASGWTTCPACANSSWPGWRKKPACCRATSTAAALALLREQRWPGNLRQLQQHPGTSGGDDRLAIPWAPPS